MGRRGAARSTAGRSSGTVELIILMEELRLRAAPLPLERGSRLAVRVRPTRRAKTALAAGLASGELVPPGEARLVPDAEAAEALMLGRRPGLHCHPRARAPDGGGLAATRARARPAGRVAAENAGEGNAMAVRAPHEREPESAPPRPCRPMAARRSARGGGRALAACAAWCADDEPESARRPRRWPRPTRVGCGLSTSSLQVHGGRRLHLGARPARLLKRGQSDALSVRLGGRAPRSRAAQTPPRARPMGLVLRRPALLQPVGTECEIASARGFSFSSL